MIDELKHRKGLKVALSGRSEPDIRRVLNMLIKYLTHPQFTRSLIGVARLLANVYGTADVSPGVAKV